MLGWQLVDEEGLPTANAWLFFAAAALAQVALLWSFSQFSQVSSEVLWNTLINKSGAPLVSGSSDFSRSGL